MEEFMVGVNKKLPCPLWKEDCPVLITGCAIADINTKGDIALLLSFQNLSRKEVEAVYVEVKGYGRMITHAIIQAVEERIYCKCREDDEKCSFLHFSSLSWEEELLYHGASNIGTISRMKTM